MEMYNKIEQAAEFLKQNVSLVPKMVLVLGSGLGAYADGIKDRTVIPYADIPGFAASTVPGHAGQLVFGTIHGLPVAVMQGRVHYYEGGGMQQVALPLRALRLMGAESILLTNAAGGVNFDFKPGDLMLIDDHINFSANSPLIGPNIYQMGPRFPDMSQAYDKTMKECMLNAAKKIDLDLKRGVYMMFTGPQFETPAEIRFVRTIGADAVGMSTVPEVIAARHCGYKICGVSCITNMAAGILDQPLNHEEVMETGAMVRDRFEMLIDTFLQEISQN